MRLYRVFPYLESARRADPGHPLYVPSTQGAGRIDNPEHYLVLYASESAAGAVAERFGSLGLWSDQMFAGPRWLEGSGRALAEVAAENEAVLDLDDAAALLDRSLKPSLVVTRRRPTSQRWALEVFRENRFAGVRWWSYWDPDTGSCGLWATESLEIIDVTPLSRFHPAVRSAAELLGRDWA